jgi:hypothetical protein
MIINPARIDRKKTAMGAESSFSLTRQAQTNHYDRRMPKPAAVAAELLNLVQL